MRKFFYYLLKPDGRSGQVVNGVVTYSGQPKPLPQTPDGWQELLIEFNRSVERHGVDATATLPLGFVRDGAKIIRDAMYKETIEASLLLLIQKLTLVITDTTFKWVYKYFYRGELDLSKVEDTQDKIEVPILEGGLNKLVKANFDTVYEFPMNDPVCVNLRHDGITLEGKANYTALDDLEISYALYGTHAALPVTFISMEQKAGGFAFFSQSVEEIPGTTTWDERLEFTNFIVQAAANNHAPIDVHITGRLRWTCTERTASSLTFSLRFYRSNQLIADQDDYEIFDGTLIQGEDGEVDVDITIPLEPGERLYFDSNSFTFIGSSYSWEFLPDSNLSFAFEFRAAATYIPCYRRFDLYKKLIARITGSEDYAVSELCTEFNNLLLTCGDSIRGIEGATLKTSLSDFYKDTDATLMAGMAILPNGVEIEARETYYEIVDEVDLGNVTELKKIPATDISANTYKFGHEKQDIEDVNGKYDPNGNNQFTGPLTKTVKEYNAVSPYKAGPYEIEILRINFDGKTTTDADQDNDVYVIAATDPGTITDSVSFNAALGGITLTSRELWEVGQKIRITGSVSNDGVYDIGSVASFLDFVLISFVQSVTNEGPVSVTIEWLVGGVYELDRPDYDTLEGVPNDTIYNLPLLTPKTMLFRHGAWIRSMNYGLETQKIKFVSGKDNKNTSLLTELAGLTIDEDKDENISGLASPLFMPWYFVFKTEVPVTLAELIEENPNRSYKFTDEYGQEWQGFLRIAGIAPNEYSPQEFRLLAAPGQDLTKLIH
jgi:hypothetical protein